MLYCASFYGVSQASSSTALYQHLRGILAEKGLLDAVQQQQVDTREGENREPPSVTEVNTLLQKFTQMQKMMKKMSKFSKMMGKMGGKPPGMMR